MGSVCCVGGVWSDCSGDKRHLSLEASAEEAMVCWSAPQPWHPEAKVFINHAINHMMGKDAAGKQKVWNVTHSHELHHGQQGIGQSLVIERHKKDPLRLPSSMYDSPAV